MQVRSIAAITADSARYRYVGGSWLLDNNTCTMYTRWCRNTYVQACVLPTVTVSVTQTVIISLFSLQQPRLLSTNWPFI